MTTKRQKAAVHFCEQWLHIRFTGNINNFYQVSDFLANHLQDAKDLYNEAEEAYMELKCEYEAYLWDLDDD